MWLNSFHNNSSRWIPNSPGTSFRSEFVAWKELTLAEKDSPEWILFKALSRGRRQDFWDSFERPHRPRTRQESRLTFGVDHCECPFHLKFMRKTPAAPNAMWRTVQCDGAALPGPWDGISGLARCVLCVPILLLRFDPYRVCWRPDSLTGTT